MRELAPILLTSPTLRCGTTLLQRLLCSSSNALIYGEEVGKDLQMQLQILTSRQLVYQQYRARFDSSLQRVLQGNVDDWLIDLMPEIDGYLQALQKTAFAGLSYCEQQAAHYARSLWGFKYPSWPPYMLQMLFEYAPNTRIIYITRNLMDCARSAKAWKAVNDEQELQQFCAQWLSHQQFMRQWQQRHPQSIAMSSYEQLISEPEHCLHQLQQFLPFEHIDIGVLKRKINNQVEGADTRHASNQYLQPVTLSEAETALVCAAITALQTP